ncbi:ATP phosphoribosyltransferase regulatory subunit [Meridianimarinicoccus sp. MJW13]|uniref:ATP phosphoribosyltransferase regulatory subunit n=1 Tax=Meridianimarinicoccus sp. MJW13 TaxID=2720031 RepID=UPI0018686BD8|nr:ATP phosphoribosyltransferase regulatory subunit [Fluviibacterium sp. MJW13]
MTEPCKSEILAEAQRLRACFEAAGATPVDADILLPAETLLDLYGEDIRARAYVTMDPLHGELMMRPDFTVPVVQAHMSNGAGTARYTYLGEVFRKQEGDYDRANEYLQVGFELFDAEAPEKADAEVYALFATLLADLPLRAATGDVGILRAAISGLKLSAPRRAALMRHLWRPRRFRTLLERFSGRTPATPQRVTLLEAHARGEDVLSRAGMFIGLRDPDEIRKRLDRLADDLSEPPLTEGELASLDQVITLKDMSPAALERLSDIAVDMPAMHDAVQRFERRLDALQARGVDIDHLPFEAEFGRTTMEYYDGFVFGFSGTEQPGLPPVALGGRYDALTRILGQGTAMPAVGGMIRPASLLDLRSGDPA